MAGIGGVELALILGLLCVGPLVGGLILVAVVALMRGSTTRCPYCAERIKKDAIVCRYCGNDLRTAPEDTSETEGWQGTQDDGQP